MENTVKNFMEGLNDEQRAAVECLEGPMLIVAGAGSGKTKVLTCRIANLLEHGAEASSILALTFTKKAAGEMKERIAAMVGYQKARRLMMGTFHSVFARFLRKYANSIGYPESFTIYDTSDSVSALKTCIKALELDDKIYKPKEVLSRISMAKNNLMTADAYRMNSQTLEADRRSRKPRICDIYSLYAENCRKSGVMDFDDILLNMNILLRDVPSALSEISSSFTHILVDEYQDTNVAQYIILKKLSSSHKNICVVGDDSQSIYAFRGARIENILNFKKDYPECRTFRLERNYRSTKTIVGAANSLIAHNSGRIPKECYSEGAEGDRIKILKAYNEGEEAKMVVSSLMDRMMKKSASYRDFAILYRTNSQSRSLEEALRLRNIPYRIYSGNSFFERAEVKDVMAYMKLCVNPSDDESFKRIVNKPARGLGDTSLAVVNAVAVRSGVSLFAALSREEELTSAGLRGAALLKLKAFREMISSLSSAATTDDAKSVASRIASETGIYAFFKSDTSIEGMSRTANVEELLNSVASFIEERQNTMIEESEEDIDDVGSLPVVTLSEFLENVTLLSNVDVSEDEESDNKVSLMTVHSSKGLEYPYVYVTGMEENLFPGSGALASPQEIEEERRLFYVALTRAGVNVELSYAASRMRNGEHNSNPPSRFLSEIDSSFLEEPFEDDGPSMPSFSSYSSAPRFGSYRYGASGAVTYERKSAPQKAFNSAASSKIGPSSSFDAPSRALPPADPSFVPEPMTAFHSGDRIEHNRFGKGTILDITGAYPELKARISFDKYGEKLILLKYAKMHHK